MANTFTVLFRGAASADSTTLYTVPADTTTLVTSVVISNGSPDGQTFDLSLGGVYASKDVSVPPNDSVIVEFKQVMNSGEIIEGLASATTVNFHISGLEIT